MLILLVEDEPIVEMIAEEFLLGTGYEVLIARLGHEAIELFRDSTPKPEMLIVDNRLPDMLGWDVVEACRSLRPDLPIVMCSGDAWTGARAIDVVQLEKPFTEDMLLQAVSTAARQA